MKDKQVYSGEKLTLEEAMHECADYTEKDLKLHAWVLGEKDGEVRVPELAVQKGESNAFHFEINKQYLRGLAKAYLSGMECKFAQIVKENEEDIKFIELVKDYLGDKENTLLKIKEIYQEDKIHAAYLGFSCNERNEYEKSKENLVARIKQMEEQEYKRPSKFEKLRSKIALYIAIPLISLSASIIGFLGLYKWHIKPDLDNLKNQIEYSIPPIPKKEEVIKDFIKQIRPEIRKELEKYNELNERNIEKAIDNVLNRYKDRPLLKMFLIKEAKKIKKQKEKKKQGKEDNF